MSTTTATRRRPVLHRSALSLAAVGAAALTAGSLLVAPSASAAPAAPPAGTTETAPPAGTTGTTPGADAALGTDIEPSVVQLYIEWSGFVGIPDEAGTIWSDEVYVASICTGFFVSDTGQIATAGHCVDPVEGRHSLVDTFLGSLVDEGVLTPDEAAATVGTAYATWPVEGLDAGSEPQRIVYAVQPKAVDGIVIEDPLAVQLVDYRSFDQGDTALLKADVTGSIPLPVSAADPTNGMAVTSVGFPASVQSVVDASRVRASFKTGSVSSQQISELGVPRTEINADLSGGMSGGPTVDSLGNVVGVNSSKIVGDQAFNFITDASDLHAWLTAKGVTLTAANVPTPEPTAEPLAAEVTTTVDDEEALALGIGVLVAAGAAILGGTVMVVLVVVLVVRRRRNAARRAAVVPPAPLLDAAVVTSAPAEGRPVSVVDSVGSVTFAPAAPAGSPAPFAPQTQPLAPVGFGTAAPAARATTGFATGTAPAPASTGTTSVLTATPPAPTAVAQAAATCRSCGAPAVDGQRFCGSCGGQL
ncbi:trypsin-like peptidase domain-containing protein [Cellulomonas aerilata]|nr:trypsin-like peptidase domain-containing protein [Cellulomonas aerilata]